MEAALLIGSLVGVALLQKMSESVSGVS